MEKPVNSQSAALLRKKEAAAQLVSEPVESEHSDVQQSC